MWLGINQPEGTRALSEAQRASFTREAKPSIIQREIPATNRLPFFFSFCLPLFLVIHPFLSLSLNRAAATDRLFDILVYYPLKLSGPHLLHLNVLHE